eukprot:CAMPEP_0182447082 /NCGR_PEP_ID=MMETSP1172-20130603/11178_1 /TAXON_ID=708627 /ORGANISM="Timspurckia oligopyrenoides, Strain CCMP3278" /LENGTH=269 /DNA_ID=CAMNT_0024643367 /DNA_START=200 /DNA_END=1009 /DNA_ORIENTATION=+
MTTSSDNFSSMENLALPDDALTSYRRNTPLDDSEFNSHITKLSHPAKFQRQRSTLTLAANLRTDTIPTLLSMLSLEDTVPRRQSVQTLGVIGIPSIVPLCDELLSTENITVRASCIKTLAAIILNYPELRKEFPDVAMETLRKVVSSSDQVTKLAAVMCLGALGQRDVTRDIGGNLEAIEVLMEVLEGSDDVGLLAAVVMSVGNIGANEKDDDDDDGVKKEMVIRGLENVVERWTEVEDGGEYVVQLALAQLEKLKSGSLTANVSSLAD